jgi:hypothetical protein
MSHAATNWAIQQRGLKPTTKIVLWHLCDRFNPDFGCFPTQERLAHDCEIGRATLNRHLDELEARRLIKRVRIVDTKTGQQRPTRYLLGFEFDDGDGARASRPSGDGNAATSAGETAPLCPPEDDSSASQDTAKTPCPDLGHGPHAETPYGDEGKTPSGPATQCPKTGQGEQRRPVSHFQQNPCLKNSDSRVSKWDTNLVREPLREPVKEEECARGREIGFDDFFGDLLQALGFDADRALPAWWQGWPARQHVQRWIDDLGMSQDRILAVARESREAHPAPPDGPKALDRAIERAVRRDAQPAANSLKAKRSSKARTKPRPSPDETAAFYAAKVNSDEYLPQNMISTTTCGLMLERGLVTLERLQMRGVL